jgi:hypothetical protein
LFFNSLDRLSPVPALAPDREVWLGKAYPTPHHTQLWLRFEPHVPPELRKLLVRCGFKLSGAPDESRVLIHWTALHVSQNSSPLAEQAPTAMSSMAGSMAAAPAPSGHREQRRGSNPFLSGEGVSLDARD